MGKILMALFIVVYALLILLYLPDTKKCKVVRPGYSLEKDIRQQAKAGNQLAKLITLLQRLVVAYVTISVVLIFLTKMR
ncbi:hypothetical protein DBR44_03450 [Aquitalea sp. FJL05]|uniref:hypothetical protein n=1 Tax=Aquitalea TaxID=407217 RepID=UPI000F5AA3BC|nr:MULTISPECIES: hypothetical protein [Aquitalea]RQO77261.1 hypothetical protein DBR44_03450 [Aquitalea sp. FJL05]